MFDIFKIFKRQKSETNTEFIPPVEEDTECDKCQHLEECIENGNVVNNTWTFHSREHYIKGRCCRCLKSCESFLEMNLSEIREIATDEEMVKFIDKAIEQLGDITYKEFHKDGRMFEMKFD